MVEFAKLCLWAAFLSAGVSIVALIIGRVQGPRAGKTSTMVGYYAMFATTLFFTIDIVVLAVAFFQPNFNFLYVATNMPNDVSNLAWLYKLSGVWAGREGSLLFWAWLLSLFSSFIAVRHLKNKDELTNIAIAVCGSVLFIFGAAMLFSDPNMPFHVTPAAVLDASGKLTGQAAAWGMNPLLQHWAMTIHPPTLFIGYAGLTIPFAYAVASIVCNDGSKRWVELSDKITIFSWFFLGIGIGLGAIWAYVVLGWGGYWAWDPVENVSLLPWLVGVALIHSFTVYKRRDGFKKWSVVLACVAFSVVIAGTFITRSGIVQSVHAFEKDTMSTVLFGILMVVPTLIGIFGVLIRGRTYDGRDEFEALTSKDAAYYLNNVLMVIATAVVMIFTIMPAIAGKTVGTSAYNMLARPIGILYLLLVAVCPLLVWGRGAGKEFWKRIMWPGIISVAVFALLMVEFVNGMYPNFVKTLASGGTAVDELAMPANSPFLYNAMAVVGLFVAALLLCTTLSLFVRGIRGRMQSKGESFGKAFYAIIFKSRSQSGGYIAHLAMSIILVGLIGSSMYVYTAQYQVPMQKGEKITMSNYTLTYEGEKDTTKSNGTQVQTLDFQVTRNGKPIGDLYPAIETPQTTGQKHLVASVVNEPLRDVFISCNNIDTANKKADITVKVNPMISFVWVGFGLLELGTILAMWPRKRKPELVAAKAKGKKGTR